MFAVWAPFLVPFLAAPAARRLAEALHPRAAAWVLATTTVTMAAASTVSLGLLAVAGLLRVPVVAALGHLSLPWLSHASPAAELLAGPAAAALLAAAALALRTARLQAGELRQARAAVDGDGSTEPARAPRLPLRAQLRRALRELVALDEHPLAVLDDDRADAYALPGRPGRIVVTAGMLRALPAPERAALLAHERAHLACRHHLFLAAAAYAAVIHPALRQLRTPLGFHLERWADECAARAVGDRAVTARAVGRAALAAARAPRPSRPSLAPAAAAGPVPRRVAALLSPHPRTGGRRRAAAAVALAACLAVSTAATLDATTDLHRSVETAQASAEHAEPRH
ncbi:M48 family metalloprotease [Kitasatospora mediocidica]|uniref:M48 family metalloprotease n=1 Tax=Kitasatospora mediocidica TaxID=58352 RepID=UPI0007C7ECC9|nr:M48 family metalloprotease [Kitasatospora mediocidica]